MAKRGRLRRRHPERKQRQIRKRLAAYRASRPRRGFSRVAVPSFFTLMNLFSGYLAIVQVHQDNFTYACWLIVLAGFFDALDGMMARIANGESLFGVELDSLADIVSFGAAPSFLVYNFGLKPFGELGLVVSALPAICGAVRLARYNIGFDGEKKDYFDGLPIPGQAIALVAIVLNYDTIATLLPASANSLAALVPIVFVLSALMVSNVQFDAIPKPTAHYIRHHPRQALAFGVALVLSLTWVPEGLLLSLAVYVLFSIGRAIYRVARAVWETPLDDADEAVLNEENA